MVYHQYCDIGTTEKEIHPIVYLCTEEPLRSHGNVGSVHYYSSFRDNLQSIKYLMKVMKYFQSYPQKVVTHCNNVAVAVTLAQCGWWKGTGPRWRQGFEHQLTPSSPREGRNPAGRLRLGLHCFKFVTWVYFYFLCVLNHKFQFLISSF